MRGREHGEEGRFERQRWEADLRDERQGEVAAEKVRRWDKFKVRKYAIYTPFFSRDNLVEPVRFGPG
jgi:hypothetical protein